MIEKKFIKKNPAYGRHLTVFKALRSRYNLEENAERVTAKKRTTIKPSEIVTTESVKSWLVAQFVLTNLLCILNKYDPYFGCIYHFTTLAILES